MRATVSLWFLVFTGFACNYMIRINLNIAIVDMTTVKSKGHTIRLCELNTTSMTNATENRNEYVKDFQWKDGERAMVLGSFYWFHWALQLPGGLLARTYGAKRIFGLSNLIMFTLSLTMPFVARWDVRGLILVRALQGFIGGMAWPSVHHLTAHWVPPNKRSKFISAYLGSSIGVAITYPLCGFIMEQWGWPYVFYSTGLLGMVWFTAWWLLVYDTPAEHPYISERELVSITSSLTNVVSSVKLPIPWKYVFSCVPFWVALSIQWSTGWALHTLMTQTPTYLDLMFSWNPQKIGIWSGLPHLTRFAFSLILSQVIDSLLANGSYTRTCIRKISTNICTVLQAVLIVAVVYSGCDQWLVNGFLLLAMTVSGASTSGPLSIMVDLSPNFASVLQGFSGIIGVIPGMISPIVLSYFTSDENTLDSWQHFFLLSGIVIAIPGLLYNFIGSSELQSWNSPDTDQELAVTNGHSTAKK
ncbi:Major facilitator superfamily,Major facilitator superfamily domain [Cinara cedri]|uniref:Major facilitator superfamily,Major facilitator superfamily domain n=1 Tax=Cinara cedri TaxID=506608 RepID=A0A5E4M326_9HEMI|nr:Major facilitator superfamily,Major facilitator superfamily domain [Cinara cedri]